LKKYLLLILFSVILKAEAQNLSSVGASNLIPLPVSCIEKNGSFTLNNFTSIVAPAELFGVANLLKNEMGIKSNKQKQNSASSIVFKKSTGNSTDEGYQLLITSNNITILSSSVVGSIHAVFTLLQLQKLQPNQRIIPCAEIKDNPRFSYRGMHLDVSRNFFPVSFIKKYIDLMAMYKYNTFHWHLTDDPGWRLEIKKYPLLTSASAFRKHAAWTDWNSNGRKFLGEGNPNAYGGYYTVADAKEIVTYAAQRGITVIPEIEMPGHSFEVTSVYPELSCTGKPYTHHEFCIGNPNTIKFLEDVLTEVMDIFPSTYIHIGGDEANTTNWEKCEKCQTLKTKNNLKDEHELQAYLIKHMERFLKSKGRKLIGWDEIIDGGLPADATVMSWRGEQGGIIAAQQNHDVVMTPGESYLDAYQSNPATQPLAIGGFLPIQKVYAYEPVPAALNDNQAKHILGTQANLWTEYMPTTYQLEYMAWPRALAIAETGWTQKEKKNFPDFQKRLQSHYLLLQRMNVNYYRPSAFLTVSEKPNSTNTGNEISFETEQYKPEIRYTTDGTIPAITSSLYTQPFLVKGKTEIKAVTFKDGLPLGEITSYTANHHKAIGKKVIYNDKWSDSYPAQKEATLTNGIRGSFTYGDKQWLGYLKNFDVTVDMDSVQAINEVSIQFMQQKGPGVFLPSHVEILFSDDGVTFTSVNKIAHDISPENPVLLFKTFVASFENQKTRYIRIVAPNTRGGFMFTDEIIAF
jgi:hexosaminidase